MVRTAKSLLRQRLVDGPRHVAVAEVKQLDSAPDFVFAQKERRCGGCLDSHLDLSTRQAYGMASVMRSFVLQRNRIMEKIGRASCRERVCQKVYITVVAVSFKEKRLKISINLIHIASKT